MSITTASAASDARFIAALLDLVAKGLLTSGTVPAGIVTILNSLLATSDFGGGGASVGAGQVAYGAALGAGLTGNAGLTFAPGGLGLVVAGEPLVLVDDTPNIFGSFDPVPASRSFEFKAPNGTIALFIDGLNATPGVRMGTANSKHITIDVAAGLVKGFLNDGVTIGWQLNLLTGTVNTPAVTPAAMGNGTINDYALATGAFNRLTADAANTALTSMAIGKDGEEKWLANIAAAGTLTIVHAAGTGTATQRFLCSGGADLVLPALTGLVKCIYDLTTGRWRAYAGF